ncbi:MAG TPA: SPFH domain-containing protein [Polyangiaceae bacterium]|nr:SPFH domain-containing protein [Polyangiaceae bacterium]
MIFFITAVTTAAFLFFAVPAALVVGKLFAFYVVVEERQSVVYELFGQVRLVIDQPGLHFPWLSLGPLAALVPFFGKRHVVDLRLDQTYLRSQPVNSEEGAPMGIGVWYEMFVSDPVSYLYKNADPRGSLVASVSNSTVRSLSNMPLERLLEDRHAMSRVVREEVSPQSREWGYQVGSVYVRKVHFRDVGMIRQIEQKVVNRLRQVTAAIQQDGSNRVNIIRSAADREAAIELAKAAAMRPRIVGAAIAKIAERADVNKALFDVLEVQMLLRSDGLAVQVIPEDASLLAQISASEATLREPQKEK